MRSVTLVVGIVLSLGCGACQKADVGVVGIVDSSDLISGVVWAERAELIERLACACRGPNCFKRFISDLKVFKNASNPHQKVSGVVAKRIRIATEAAMRCAMAESDG